MLFTSDLNKLRRIVASDSPCWTFCGFIFIFCEFCTAWVALRGGLSGRALQRTDLIYSFIYGRSAVYTSSTDSKQSATDCCCCCCFHDRPSATSATVRTGALVTARSGKRSFTVSRCACTAILIWGGYWQHKRHRCPINTVYPLFIETLLILFHPTDTFYIIIPYYEPYLKKQQQQNTRFNHQGSQWRFP